LTRARSRCTAKGQGEKGKGKRDREPGIPSVEVAEIMVREPPRGEKEQERKPLWFCAIKFFASRKGRGPDAAFPVWVLAGPQREGRED